jgi:hypothetical protein
MQEAQAKDEISQHLSEQYHKARNHLTLVGAILLAWALIGIEIKKQPLHDVDISFQSPEVAPSVLMLLILYFGIRTVIEWFQSDRRRRKSLASRIDVGLAYLIGALALSVQGLQQVYRIRIAHLFATPFWHVILMVLLLCVVAVFVLIGFSLMQGAWVGKFVGSLLWIAGVVVWAVASHALGAPWWIDVGGVLALLLLPAYAYIVAHGSIMSPDF